MRIFILSLLWAVIILPYSVLADLDKPTLKNPVEGRHYIKLANPGKTKAPPGKVEVVDFFWYGCPHCYKQLDYTEQWEKDKPSYVYVRKVPVPFSGLWTIHARAYYTALRLNMSKQLHRPIFDAIHKERQQLNNQRTLKNFFISQGVDAARFDNIYDSFSVDARIRSAQKEVDFYKINSVPTFIINGKYMTDNSMAGSSANIIEVIKYLTAREHQLGPQEQG